MCVKNSRRQCDRNPQGCNKIRKRKGGIFFSAIAPPGKFFSRKISSSLDSFTRLVKKKKKKKEKGKREKKVVVVVVVARKERRLCQQKVFCRDDLKMLQKRSRKIKRAGMASRQVGGGRQAGRLSGTPHSRRQW